MKNVFEKIKALKIEILSACLIVLLLALLNGHGPMRETMGSGAVRETEDESGESGSGSEDESETWDLTPAERAAYEREVRTGAGEDTQADAASAKSDAGETAASEDIPILLAKMLQLQESFHMPTATRQGAAVLSRLQMMPALSGQEEESTEYQAANLVWRWQTVSRIYRISGNGFPGAAGLPAYSPEEEHVIIGYGGNRPFALLKRMVEKRIDDYDGDWSVYVKNLSTGESFAVNDRPMKSASVMKLFILGTVYKAIEAGELERTDELVSLMNNMITASDNEASNRLLYMLGNSSYEDGVAKVDAFIREHGFSDMTVEYNGFNDSEMIFDTTHSNQVSAKDCGKLLEDIYRRSWVNRAAANEIEQMLLNQDTRYKIPAGLPEGVLCGNKTGEMETTENDAAIVYAKNCDYILVVLSSDWGNKNQAISRIASMSGMVYEFLN